MRRFNLSALRIMAFGISAGEALVSSTARGQIFVTEASPRTIYAGAISEYATSGATVNASLIADYGVPYDIAMSGSNIFVSNTYFGTVGEYTTSGATVNANLISGIDASAIAVSGSNLFVVKGPSDDSNVSIGEYTTSGAPVNTSLITGLNDVDGLVVSGSYIFVTSEPGIGASGLVSEYTTSGTLVNASLVSGLYSPYGIAVSGSDIFVANAGNNTIGEYTLGIFPGTISSSNPNLVTYASGLNEPWDVAVSGPNLFVVNPANGGTSGTIGEYTTSGATVSAPLVSGLSEPTGIGVTPPTAPTVSSPSNATFAGISSGSIVDPLAPDSQGDQSLSNSNGQVIFTTTDGSIFTTITLPSTVAGTLDVSVDGIDLGQFQPGQEIDFSDFASELGDLLIGDPGVESFEITGLDGLTNFPLELNFDNSSADFSVTTSVPEPASLSVLALGSVALLRRRRTRRNEGR
jgi:hypothetical protein